MPQGVLISFPASIPERELLLLRALCQPGQPHMNRGAVLRKLHAYRWLGGDHSVVFRALLMLASGNPGLIREQLAPCCTRLGFPDMDFDPYFLPQQLSREQVMALVDLLVYPGKKSRRARGRIGDRKPQRGASSAGGSSE